MERYHRRLTENFANAHFNLAVFVEIIRKEFKYNEERITEIRQNGSGIRYEHPENKKNQIIVEFPRFPYFF
ncbi:hypothetical protein HZS_6977 [Henneguya salminicola]|nr:hypothetical protein HZS_6977 [Henneguya salminicola]